MFQRRAGQLSDMQTAAQQPAEREVEMHLLGRQPDAFRIGECYPLCADIERGVAPEPADRDPDAGIADQPGDDAPDHVEAERRPKQHESARREYRQQHAADSASQRTATAETRRSGEPRLWRKAGRAHQNAWPRLI